VQVTVEGGEGSLRGPSVLVANGTISDAWWQSLV